MSQTVERALDIVSFIAERPRTLGEVAELLGVHKSTALRLIQTLESRGFAHRSPDGRHVAGLALVALGQSALEQIDLRTIAHPVLRALSDRVGHTIHLAQRVGEEILYIDKVEGAGTVAMGSRVGRAADLHTAGVSKAILAFMNDAGRRSILKRAAFEQYTSTTILTMGALLSELDITRQRGWAEDDGEKEDYINCVALPIFDASGQVTAAMSVTALRAVAPLEDLRERVPEFRRVAVTISRELGWKGEDYARR